MFDINTKTEEYGSLIVTHECNKKCPFCIDSYRGRLEYVDMNSVKEAVFSAKQLNLKTILLVGGEPTLHPDIVKIAQYIKDNGIETVLTTNFSKLDIVQKLDGIVDNFNISYYNQDIPIQNNFKSDFTISALIHKKQLSTKNILDRFIDKYKNWHLKFSTLSVCNKWTKKNQKVLYLDSLKGKHIVLFNEIEGLIYRNCIIKRYDKIINTNAKQSIKYHVDGEISRSWVRSI